jgi:hypothetical protein
MPADIASRRSTLRLMSIAGVQGFASWVFVEARIATEAPDGDTSTWTLQDWAALAQWPGDPRVFMTALVEAGLVLCTELGTWLPAGWSDEQPHLIHARQRSAAATKAAQTRWNRFVQPELFSESARDFDASRSKVAMPVSNRSEPNRSDTEGQTAGASLALAPAGMPPPFHADSWPEGIRDVAGRLREVFAGLLAHDKPTLDRASRARLDSSLAAILLFDDPPYWSAIDAWLGGDDSRVFYLDEWRKWWAWNTAQPLSSRRRAVQQAFRNWLAKTERWKEIDAQRKEIDRVENPRRRR